MSVQSSTIPLALRGANAISTITALRGSWGSTSPNARPTSFSYWPTAPNDMPSNVGDSTRVITILVMSASANGVHPTEQASTAIAAMVVLPGTSPVAGSLLCSLENADPWFRHARLDACLSGTRHSVKRYEGYLPTLLASADWMYRCTSSASNSR